MITDLDYTPQERAAIVAWHLARGDELTNWDIERLTGLSSRRVRELMCGLARVLPIHCAGGRWQYMGILLRQYSN